MAVIPKTPNPETISKLRLISCCNFIYKVVSKVIVGGMKPLINSIITPQQSAFVGGRMIQDNLVVAHEAFHYLKKKH